MKVAEFDEWGTHAIEHATTTSAGPQADDGSAPKSRRPAKLSGYELKRGLRRGVL